MNKANRHFSSAKSEFLAGTGRDNGSEWVALEDFRPYRIYAITYCPGDQPSDCTDRSLTTFHWAIVQDWPAVDSGKGVVYYMLPEFGKNNRLHYHGIIAFRTGMDYIRFKDERKGEHTVMKEIFGKEGYQKWYKYITKQWTHLKKVFFVAFTNCRRMLNDYYEHYVFVADNRDDPT